MSRIINNNKSLLNNFKQVDNSNLDKMSYNLWNNSSIYTYSNGNLFYDDSTMMVNSSTLLNMDKVDEISTTRWLEPSSVAKNRYDDQETSNSIISMRRISSNHIDPNNSMCTLYIDMTFDDRVFFGVHNFFLLKYSLSESQCNVDFSAPNNKVSIIGQSRNVAKMCKSFFFHSTFALQFEFYFFDEITCSEYMKDRFIFLQKEYEKWDVYISYRPEKPNILLFNFLTFRKFSVRLIQTMIYFQKQLEFYQLGKVLPNFMSTLQIPVIRRDSNGINNVYIESIENETNTKIKTIRYHDCQHYPFENVIITGTDILSLMKARWLLTTRFDYELKFQVTIRDTELLVKVISSLKYDRRSIDITISPGTINCGLNSKIVSIKSNEKNIDKIFCLHKELLGLMMDENCRKFSV